MTNICGVKWNAHAFDGMYGSTDRMEIEKIVRLHTINLLPYRHKSQYHNRFGGYFILNYKQIH